MIDTLRLKILNYKIEYCLKKDYFDGHGCDIKFVNCKNEKSKSISCWIPDMHLPVYFYIEQTFTKLICSIDDSLLQENFYKCKNLNTDENCGNTR